MILSTLKTEFAPKLLVLTAALMMVLPATASSITSTKMTPAKTSIVELATSSGDYATGEAVTKNISKELALYKDAAKKGAAKAQFNLGMMYFFGNGVEKNEAEAIKWYKKSADQGYAPAQYYLGLAYSTGAGVQQNNRTAFKLIEKAAKQNLSMAQFSLGSMYQEGVGVAQNKKKAFEWTMRAANQNDLNAMIKLGIMYSVGDGVAKDIEKSNALLRKTIKQSEVMTGANVGAGAEALLGLNQLESAQTADDYEKAVKTLRSASSKGNPIADYSLASLYEKGFGGAANEGLAKELYKKACDGGYQAACGK